MNDLLVLSYHGISEDWPAETTVRPGDFEEQLTALVRRGYRGATVSDALGLSPVEERTVVVTFDDAHRSVLEHAAPVMARLGIPGTVYVPTSYAGTDTPMAWGGYDHWLGSEHEDELLCMSWDELRGLADEGWEVGSHTRSHPRLSQIEDAQIAEELVGSRRDCEEQMGRPCTSFAYPYSDYDARAVRAAGEAGYRFAVTVPTRPTPPLPLEWPRIGVNQGEKARRVLYRARSRRMAPSLPARAALAARRLAR